MTGFVLGDGLSPVDILVRHLRKDGTVECVQQEDLPSDLMVGKGTEDIGEREVAGGSGDKKGLIGEGLSGGMQRWEAFIHKNSLELPALWPRTGQTSSLFSWNLRLAASRERREPDKKQKYTGGGEEC